MYFPIFAKWTSPFPILGLLGGILHLYSNFKRKLYLQTVEKPDQTPQSTASDLVLHCLLMSNKKDAGLI